MNATYTKLNSGDWGVKIVGEKPAEGSAITVKKKSGESKIETIGKVIWSGSGAHLCTITKAGAASTSSGSRSGRQRYTRRGDGGPRGSRPCYMCGSYYCEGARGGLCEDD